MIKKINITSDFSIPIEVKEVEGLHVISIDGTVWVKTDNQVHAAVLFNMMADHITEYMTYQPK